VSAPKKILVIAGLVAVIGCLAGPANAEPKNQWPFIRHADSRGLAQTAAPTVAPGPRPEAKNELPFTRPVVVVASSSGHHAGTAGLGLSGSGSGGIDWPLMAWVAVAAAILTGGALVFLRSTWSTTHRPV
jgi:hypothetical protein